MVAVFPRSNPRRLPPRPIISGLVVGLSALLLSACTDAAVPSPEAVETTTTSSTIPVSIVRPSPKDLKTVCPNPVVIQLNRPVDVWALPFVGVSAVDGRTGAAAYRAAMLDPVSVLPLGIDIEIRTAQTIGGGSVIKAMKADPTIMLGAISTDELLKANSSIKAVFAPWERNDLAVAWPASLGAKTAAELPVGSKPSDPPPGVEKGVEAYLNASGLFAAPKTSPQTTVKPLADAVTTTLPPPVLLAWVQLMASPNVAQDTTLTVQPVDELGWEPYPFVMVATEATRTTYEQCLRGLIPVLQGGAVRVTREPDRLSANLATISARLITPVDIAVTSAAAALAIKLGIVGNGSDATLGDVAAARLAQFVRAKAIAAEGKAGEFPDLEREMRDKIDSRFIDPLIGRS